jgi:hypothetical protein
VAPPTHCWAVVVVGIALVEGAVILGCLTFLAPALESVGFSPTVAGLVVGVPCEHTKVQVNTFSAFLEKVPLVQGLKAQGAEKLYRCQSASTIEEDTRGHASS